jgi:hypothetical protein
VISSDQSIVQQLRDTCLGLTVLRRLIHKIYSAVKKLGASASGRASTSFSFGAAVGVAVIGVVVAGNFVDQKSWLPWEAELREQLPRITEILRPYLARMAVFTISTTRAFACNSTGRSR